MSVLLLAVISSSATLSLTACSEPSLMQAQSDVGRFVNQELGDKVEVFVLDYALEDNYGDSYYYNARIKLRSEKYLYVPRGPFSGITLRPGVTTPIIKLSMVYRFERRRGTWRLHEIWVDH